jgi:hypothetical protein
MLNCTGRHPLVCLMNVITPVAPLSNSSQSSWAYSLQQIILPNQMLALPEPLSGAIDLTPIFA